MWIITQGLGGNDYITQGYGSAEADTTSTGSMIIARPSVVLRIGDHREKEQATNEQPEEKPRSSTIRILACISSFEAFIKADGVGMIDGGDTGDLAVAVHEPAISLKIRKSINRSKVDRHHQVMMAALALGSAFGAE